MQKETEIIKYERFIKDISDKKTFLMKLEELFEIQYEEMFNSILIKSKEQFINSIYKSVMNILKNKYSSKIKENNKFISYMNLYINKIETKYNKAINEIISESNTDILIKQKGDKYNININNIDIILNKQKNILSFLKHCSKCSNIPKHNCSPNNISSFIPIIFNNNSIKYILCSECHLIFYSNIFLNYCENCKENYYSYIISLKDKKNLYPATWSKYHCNKDIINEKMRCIKCDEIFYIDINENILRCLNNKCKLIIKNPKNLEWKCKYCFKKFYSDIKLFNPLEKIVLDKEIKKALIYTNKFEEKKCECNGELFLGLFMNKKIIVCDKCKKVGLYYDNNNKNKNDNHYCNDSEIKNNDNNSFRCKYKLLAKLNNYTKSKNIYTNNYSTNYKTHFRPNSNIENNINNTLDNYSKNINLSNTIRQNSIRSKYKLLLNLTNKKININTLEIGRAHV